MSKQSSGEYLGRFRLGQLVPLKVWVRDTTDAGHPADAPPLARLFDSTGTRLLSMTLPSIDRYGVDGLYGGNLRLGFGLSVGHYCVTYSYSVGGRAFITRDAFEVVPGGDASGTVISLCSVDRPEASYVLAQVTSGRILQGRNPRT